MTILMIGLSSAIGGFFPVALAAIAGNDIRGAAVASIAFAAGSVTTTLLIWSLA